MMRFDISKFSYLLYPIAVVIFLFLSLNYLVFDYNNPLNSAVNSEKNKETIERINKMQDKLKILKSIDATSARSDLESATYAMPAVPSIWNNALNVRDHASKVSASVEMYKATSGDVLDASASATTLDTQSGGKYQYKSMNTTFVNVDFPKMVELAELVNTSLPMNLVGKVEFTQGRGNIDTLILYQPFPRAASLVNVPLVSYQENWDRIIAIIGEIEVPQKSVDQKVEDSSTNLNTSPF